jgi:HSP20 family protein
MATMKRLLTDLAAIERQLAELGGGQRLSAEQGPGTWSPAVDIYETETEFVLTAEVPGLKRDEIEIQVVERNLVLRGERRWEREAHAEHFHRLESTYGKFERTFNLSEGIDIERISAELSDGVLSLSLPKRASGGKQIEVKMGEENAEHTE